MLSKPRLRPQRPFFSSGPCAKPPEWSFLQLSNALVGRYHRSEDCKARLAEVFARSRALLKIPADYHLYLLPASDTGAFEAALWNFLGPESVDVLAWDRFGRDWSDDTVGLLGGSSDPDHVRIFAATDGFLPDLQTVDCDHDIVFPWTGTSTGVAVPDGNWISDTRSGLTLCDATSAVFAVDLPWEKLDATSFSWQKAMGGEAQHGFLVLSPRARQRLTTNPSSRWLPKIFRLGQPDPGSNNIEPVNTPSLLCIEDALAVLSWIESIGGVTMSVARTQANFAVIDEWVATTPWVDHLASQPEWRAMTPVCLRLQGMDSRALGLMVKILGEENVAYDIIHYRCAPPGLRIWTGPTIETEDLVRLLPWLNWAYEQVVCLDS